MCLLDVSDPDVHRCDPPRHTRFAASRPTVSTRHNPRQLPPTPCFARTAFVRRRRIHPTSRIRSGVKSLVEKALVSKQWSGCSAPCTRSMLSAAHNPGRRVRSVAANQEERPRIRSAAQRGQTRASSAASRFSCSAAASAASRLENGPRCRR